MPIIVIKFVINFFLMQFSENQFESVQKTVQMHSKSYKPRTRTMRSQIHIFVSMDKSLV